ncbi:MAG TPA: hypothetical protein VK619_06105 [Pyrinomonadaceae bacterium]|nr:hypothetical protein [Pyrinomonadaceae bacterium]
MSTQFSNELKELRRQKLFRQITQSALPVHTCAHLAAKYQRMLEAAAQKLQALREINLELMMTDAKRRAGYFIVLVAAIAVYGIDFILLSAVAEYFARRVYSDPFMVMLARLVIPAAILIIEMMIASQRAFAHEWATEYGGSKTSWVWIVFSLLLLCFLPAMLVATHVVTMPATVTQVLETVNILQIAGLIALAVVMHGVILYGGQLAVEAKAYLYLRIRSWRLNQRIKRLDNKFHKAATAAMRAYILHERAVQEYKVIFPNTEMSAGPFDLTTRQLLHTRLGRELPGLPQPSGTLNEESQSSAHSIF